MANERQRQTKKNFRGKPRLPVPQGGNPTTAVPTAVPTIVPSLLTCRPALSSKPAWAVSKREDAVDPVYGAVRNLDSIASLVQAATPPAAIKPVAIAPAAAITPAAITDAATEKTVGACAWSSTVDAKIVELVERSKAFERERLEIETLREQLKIAIESAEVRLASTSSDAGIAKGKELELQLIASQEDCARVSDLLLHARNEYLSLLEFIDTERETAIHSTEQQDSVAKELLEQSESREKDLTSEVSLLHEQIQFLQNELSETRAHAAKPSEDDSEIRIQVEQLRSQLLEARHETVELRMQNNDLGSRLAKFQGPVAGQRSETMSWEQRKEALLQQLESEVHSETPCDPRKVLEIEKVIEQTSLEIARRDAELSDLKALLEQQAVARDGMSIGVGAIAQMIESDDLVVAERLRLQEMREEWEGKQRQAEIEMSMERAKIARERLDLQEQIRSNEITNPPRTEEEQKQDRPRGRWLARLGLRDE